MNVFLLFMSVVGLFMIKPELGEIRSKHLPPPATLDKTHFGFNLALADLLWLTFIQKSFDCSRYKSPDNCAERWPFKVLDEASQLDPKFKVLYLHGAVHLSVINDDHQGAADLFDRAFTKINDSWVLYYRAAYIESIELGNKEKAADYLVKASNLGAPPWTKSLASKLYTELGQIELSYRTLKDLYDKTTFEPRRVELKERLEKLAILAKKASRSQE